LRAARGEMRYFADLQTRAAQIEERSFAQWQSTEGERTRAAALQPLSIAPDIKRQLFPVSASLPPMCECRRCLSNVERLAHASSVHGARSIVPRLMDFDVAQKHAPIMHGACEPILDEVDNKARSKRPPPCWKVGICICPPQNVLIFHMRQRFYAALRLVCRPRTPRRELLVGHELFARLEGRRDVPTDPWEAAASELLHGGGIGAEASCAR